MPELGVVEVHWKVERHWVRWSWTVEMDTTGSSSPSVSGGAWSRRSAMAKTEQVLRMYQIMKELMLDA